MRNSRFYNRSLFLPLATLALSMLACGLSSTESAPTISVLSPPQGSEISAGETVEVMYHAEDAQGVTRVEMTLNGSVVAAQDAPVPQGQTPLEGVLRWTSETAGTFNLILTAYNADDERSAPAGVSIFVSGEAAQAEPAPAEAPPPAAECAPSEAAAPNTFSIPAGMHLNSYVEPGGEIDGTFEVELTFTVLEERDGFLLVSWDAPDSGTYQTWVLKEDVVACLPPSSESAAPAQPAPTEPQPAPTEGVRLETALHLPKYELFDLDNGTKLTPAGGFKDFWINVSESGQPQLEPDQTMVGITPLLAVWGTTEPTYADCSAAALAGDPIPLAADVLSGAYVCIQTGEGLFGYLRLDALRPDPEVGDDALDAVYALWDSGGNERIVPHELHTFRITNVASESGKDLDFWENTQVEDVAFEITETEVVVTPLGAASLALWGTTFPTKEDCLSMTLGAEPVAADKSALLNFTDVFYICYQTDQGRLGRLEISGVTEDPDILATFYYTDVPQVDYSYDTWE